jgi:hypothetical protein
MTVKKKAEVTDCRKRVLRSTLLARHLAVCIEASARFITWHVIEPIRCPTIFPIVPATPQSIQS